MNSALPTPRQILVSTTDKVAIGKAFTKTVDELVTGIEHEVLKILINWFYYFPLFV